MFISKRHLSRRTLLRGSGLALALPFLDAMVPAATALAATAAAPAPRLGFFYFPHGAIMEHWTPQAVGTEFEMSPILESLAPFKSQLTILSNPYCNPCSKMHKRIEQLLQKTNNNIGIEYFLSSFKEEWNSTNKYLIAACLADDSDSAMQLITDWFENGKALRDEYYKDWGLDIGAPEVEAEFQKHEA